MHPKDLDDEALLSRLKLLANRERENVAEVVIHLAEADQRDLLIERGFPSLFIYCVKELGYSEQAAYCRIRVARISRRFPGVVTMLRSGEIGLESLVRLHPHLEGERGEALLESVRGKSISQVAAMLAELSPEPEVPDVIRPVGRCPGEAIPHSNDDLFSRIPPSADSAPEPAAPVPAQTEPPSLPRVRFAFTADEALLALVKRVRELLRHKFPDGRLEKVFKEALEALLDKRDPSRRLLAALPRPSKARRRKIPQWVRDQVQKRDGGACAYVSEDGRRCGSAEALEYDHIKPWALGGVSDDPSNVRLLCRPHNQLLAREIFGDRRSS